MKPLADITVLIAEDERPVRMLLRVVLESAGARVIEAEHGAAALRLLDLHPEVDLVCTDVNMPILDGVALVAAIRDGRRGLPVIACTAMNVEDSYPSLAPMIDGVVQKPFIPSELVRAIDSALTVRERRDSFTAS